MFGFKGEYKGSDDFYYDSPDGLSHADCPKCGVPVPKDAIDKEGMAVCGNCGDHFKVALSDIAIFERNKPYVQLPRNMEYLKLHSMLEFIYKPKVSMVTSMFFVTLFWNSIVGIFVMAAFMSGEYGSLIFLSLHILVGISLIALTLGNLINKTYVTINQENLIVEKKPLQFLRKPAVSTDDITQLYVKKYTSGSINERPIYAYGLYARLKNNKEIKILDNMATPEHAQFLEQEIEIFLGIKDRAVAGEI